MEADSLLLSRQEHPFLKDAIEEFSIKNQPYTIQIDFMNDLLQCFDSNSIGFFESPTGTGKSMSVLCASIAYIKKKNSMLTYNFLSSESDSEAESQIPIRLMVATRTHSQIKELVSELKKLKECAKNLMIQNDQKRAQLQKNFKSVGLRDKPFIQKEIEDCTNKIKFYKDYLKSFPKVVSLASRKLLCVHPEYSQLSANELNDVCSPKCPFYNKESIINFSEHISEEPLDIEDLYKYGSSHQCCPYFSSRKSVKKSQVILFPYQTLFSPETRSALKLSIRNSCIIIDEAHNLIDSLNSLYTITLTQSDIQTAYTSLLNFRKSVSSRRPRKSGQEGKSQFEEKEEEEQRKLATNYSSILIKATLSLQKVFEQKEPPKVLKMNDFQIEYNIDVGNMFSIIEWAKETQLVYKLSHENKKLSTEEISKKSQSVRNYLDFISSMGNLDDQGCVLVDSVNTKLTYMLLNPSNVFTEVSSKAKSVVLVGGTLRPFEDMIVQLTSSDEKILTHTNGHVIPKENCLAMCIKRGPSNQQLRFTHETRYNRDMLVSISQAVLDLSLHVPNGMIIFFTSFEYMTTVYNFMKNEFYFDEIQKNKFLLCESKDTKDLNTIMKTYKSHINNSSGAILFAVINGKLSEGINFADNYCRCVMIVGMPFADTSDVVLRQRMLFFDDLKKNGKSKCDGKQFYDNMCMRAVNQSIGRSFRNINDFAAVVLFDERYEKYAKELPSWILRSFSVVSDWNHVIDGIDVFFKDKN
ncbi:ATP-dependent RNA helicase CHL1 [Histomonas meleagridis]|uniref:ATP-dependent RNA helicase CHL1 n=1 Tax=Histomonas meleagridis TaxID=135588 RepID=UPI00355A42DC|nr:ATP-dependent RNA helicase CHL1 [Histomonas meleagridis]KAH0801416.1 ATP-dependent RNA helicase CHL1 [Histomonas meleagridis]